MRSLCFIAIIILHSHICPQNCPSCGGDGIIAKQIVSQTQRKCDQCKSGYNTCNRCKGKGTIMVVWTTREWKHGRWGKIIGRKKIVNHSRLSVCPICKGRTRIACKIPNCHQGHITQKVSQTVYIPCTAKNCPGNSKEIKSRRLSLQLLLDLKKSMAKDDTRLLAKPNEEFYNARQKILETFSLAAKEAIINNEWDKFVKRFGKEEIIAILGKETYTSLCEFNKAIQSVPKDVKMYILQEAKSTPSRGQRNK